jgi:hypothetical protein
MSMPEAAAAHRFCASWRLALVLLATGAWAVACSNQRARAPGGAVRPAVFEYTGAFVAPNLTESSGVVVSRRHAGVLWTHNDSEDGAYLYASTLAGEDLGGYHIANAWAVDWEDIALGPCPESDESCLYIADTGDNNVRRSDAGIYILKEPDALPVPGRWPFEEISARRLALRYEDGPCDVEAMAVTPEGQILLITKGRSGPIRLFRIDRLAAQADSAVPRPTDTLNIVPQRNLGRLPTGAAMSPDGERLVVRTYTELYFYRLEGEDIAPESKPCWLGTQEPQGEAVDFLDNHTLVVTSEAKFGLQGTIGRVRCPTLEGQEAQ